MWKLKILQQNIETQLYTNWLDKNQSSLINKFIYIIYINLYHVY